MWRGAVWPEDLEKQPIQILSTAGNPCVGRVSLLLKSRGMPFAPVASGQPIFSLCPHLQAFLRAEASASLGPVAHGGGLATRSPWSHFQVSRDLKAPDDGPVIFFQVHEPNPLNLWSPLHRAPRGSQSPAAAPLPLPVALFFPRSLGPVAWRSVTFRGTMSNLGISPFFMRAMMWARHLFKCSCRDVHLALFLPSTCGGARARARRAELPRSPGPVVMSFRSYTHARAHQRRYTRTHARTHKPTGVSVSMRAWWRAGSFVFLRLHRACCLRSCVLT